MIQVFNFDKKVVNSQLEVSFEIKELFALNNDNIIINGDNECLIYSIANRMFYNISGFGNNDYNTVTGELYVVRYLEKSLKIFKIYSERDLTPTLETKFEIPICKILSLKENKILIGFNDHIIEYDFKLQKYVMRYQNTHEIDTFYILSNETNSSFVILCVHKNRKEISLFIKDQKEPRKTVQVNSEVVHILLEDLNVYCLCMDHTIRILEINSLDLLKKIRFKYLFWHWKIAKKYIDDEEVIKNSKITKTKLNIVLYINNVIFDWDLNLTDAKYTKRSKSTKQTTSDNRNLINNEIKESYSEYIDEKQKIVAIDKKIKELQPDIGLSYNELVDYVIVLSNESYLLPSKNNKSIKTHIEKEEFQQKNLNLTNSELVEYAKFLSLENNNCNEETNKKSSGNRIQTLDLTNEEAIQYAIMLSLEEKNKEKDG